MCHIEQLCNYVIKSTGGPFDPPTQVTINTLIVLLLHCFTDRCCLADGDKVGHERSLQTVSTVLTQCLLSA